MSNTKLKNLNYDNFEKLYKELYGKDYQKGASISRVDGMNDRDYEVFKVYANRKNEDLNDQETYNQSKNVLEDREKQARIQADIQMDRLNKYLPQQMQNRGLGGANNLTESALIQAKNNYQNQLGKIDSDYSQYQIDLLNNYNKSIDENKKLYDERGIIEEYANKQYGDLIEKLAEYSTSYNELNQFEEYFKNNNDYIDDYQRNQIESQLGMYRNSDSIYDEFLKDIKDNIDSADDFEKLSKTNKILNSSLSDDRKNQMITELGLNDYKGKTVKGLLREKSSLSSANRPQISAVGTGEYSREGFGNFATDYVTYNGTKSKIIPIAISDSKVIKKNFSETPNNSIVSYNGQKYYKRNDNLWYRVV